MSYLNKNIENYPTVLFHCSPSLGMLDSCLSFLKVLKAKLPNACFIFLASDENTLGQIYLENELIKISETIFDKIVFRTFTGVFISSDTFKKAKKLNDSFIFRIFYFVKKILNRFRLKFLYKLIQLIFHVPIEIIFSKNIYKLTSLKNTKYVTIFDVNKIFKDNNEDLYDIVSNSPNFSILHGTGIKGVQTNNDPQELFKIKNFIKRTKFTKKTTAYLFSKNEISFYKELYNLKEEQIKVYGIPKHEKQWIENFEVNNIETNKKYIFIISRPTNEFITIGRRIKFLKMIKKIAIKYKLELVVKLHPRELTNRLYEKVFDSNGEKVKWRLSYKHPYSLGKKCEFAISYYSGVPVDLINLGVPTIELSDFRGIAGDDHKLSMRNSRGEAVREYRYLNLVLGATSEDEFEKHVKNILYNKNKVVKDLQKNYNKLFPITQNINDKIAEEIKKSIVASVN